MSISDNYVPVKTLGDGVTNQYSAAWSVLAASYMRVYLQDVVTGIQVLQVLGTAYTLAFSSNGLTVTFLPGFIPTNASYVILSRSVAQDQPLPYKTAKGFQGPTIEQSFDKLTAITQDLRDGLNRAPKAPVGSGVNLALPNPNPSKAIIWNLTGDQLINSTYNVDDMVTLATAQAVIATNQANSASTSAGNASTSEGNALTYRNAAQAAAAAAQAAAGTIWCGTAGGTANALTLTPATAITGYTAGQRFSVVVGLATTSGTVTGNVSGQGALTIQKSIGNGLVALGVADFQPGMVLDLEYNGTVLVWKNPKPYSFSALASAATVNLSSSAGDYVSITGTTTITALTLTQGQEKTLVFAASLTLTNGANLVLPTGANIVTQAGDTAVFRAESGGVIRCINYQRATGASLLSSTFPYIHIQDQRASGTGGDATTGGSYVGLTLNTSIGNTIPGASLASNLITLPAGTYDYDFSAVMSTGSTGGVGSRIQLYNNTDATVIQNGFSNYSQDGSCFLQAMKGRFTLAAQKDIAFRGYVSAGGGAWGITMAIGTPEIYKNVYIEKVA